VGTTFVYVTHDQEEAMSMSTRIAVMSDGRIQQIGTPSEIYFRPRSRFVADFIGESNFLSVTAESGSVRLADGRSVPCSVNGWNGGKEATLMVRPEVVRLFAPAEAPEGALRGKILQSSFLGSETRVAVASDASDAPFVSSQFGRDRIAAGELTPDREVALWWESHDAVLLPVQPTEEEED
jgi:putative spermidine/putrescine transport system ATP-binding protein